MSITKIHRIVTMDICQSHPNKKAYNTDTYYAKLANQLLDDFTYHAVHINPIGKLYGRHSSRQWPMEVIFSPKPTDVWTDNSYVS